MTHHAYVDGGLVVEVIQPMQDAEGIDIPVELRFTPDFCSRLVACGDEVQQGWRYEAGTFLEPVVPEVPAVVPIAVSQRQAHLALLDAGLLDQAEALIDGIADATEKRRAQIEWSSPTYERASPFLQLLAGQLGLDDAALDALFIKAAAL